ncbi:YheC/YheD family protein [Paenibacillus hamazuiensis]|uniref:YheC/YheD family protein n=1 Tax=Paenibacillus hamazuiensis TaxID=2936508 RepID=UPI00200EFA5A|nr:YheC/YheD family protein [Paenibacillus hamazuiensis]
MPGKWGLHRFYAKDNRIKGHLPPTEIFRLNTLRKFMRLYGSVYIKPNMEHMGKGIVKAWRISEGYTFVKVRGKPSPAVPTVRELYRMLNITPKSSSHIIQKTIELAEIDGRPFDIRVMMMRNGRGKWEYAAMLAKVAGQRSIVTNVRRGRGYVLEVPEALKKTKLFGSKQIGMLEEELIELSERICRRFDKYKRSSQIGIDFAVDRAGRIWVIEINFDFPSHELFKKLPDLTAYRKIKRMAAVLRRLRRKRSRRIES